MATIAQDIKEIRTGVIGKDVREAIADALEKCYYHNGHIVISGLDVVEDETGLIIYSSGLT